MRLAVGRLARHGSDPGEELVGEVEERRRVLAHPPPQLVLILSACGGAVEGRSQVRAALELFRNLAGRSEREALLRRGLERTTPGPVCGAGASGEAERVDASNQGA